MYVVLKRSERLVYNYWYYEFYYYYKRYLLKIFNEKYTSVAVLKTKLNQIRLFFFLIDDFYLTRKSFFISLYNRVTNIYSCCCVRILFI